MDQALYLSKPACFVHRKHCFPVFVTLFECLIGSQSKQINSEVLNRVEKILLFCKAISLGTVSEFLSIFCGKGSFVAPF